MSKKGLTFTFFAALGAIAGYVTYMTSKNEFSDETKEKYSKVVNNFMNVSTDIKRSYTSIGNRDAFTENTRKLGNNAINLASKTGDLVASASTDMYNFAKKKISNDKKVEKDEIYDDLDAQYVSTKGGNPKKRNKRIIKNTKKQKNIKTNKKTS